MIDPELIANYKLYAFEPKENKRSPSFLGIAIAEESRNLDLAVKLSAEFFTLLVLLVFNAFRGQMIFFSLLEVISPILGFRADAVTLKR